MAGLSITGQMKVSTLQKGFLKEFGLTLRVYDGRGLADSTQTLSQVRKKKGGGKGLSVAKNMKVGNLEDKFEEEFGLKVQVSGLDDSYLCKDNLTLNAAQQADEKKLARKGRKAARQDEASDDDSETSPLPSAQDSGTGTVGLMPLAQVIDALKEQYSDHTDYDDMITDLNNNEYLDHWANRLCDQEFNRNIEIARSLYTLLLEKSDTCSDILGLAENILNEEYLNDKIWAKSLYGIAIEKAGVANEYKDIAISIAQKEKLNDSVWARDVFEKAIERAADVYDYREIAEAIADEDGLNNKDWAKEIFQKAIDVSEGVTDHQSIANSIADEYYLNDKVLGAEVMKKGIDSFGITDSYEATSIAYDLVANFDDKPWAKTVYQKGIDICKDDKQRREVIEAIRNELEDTEWADEIADNFGIIPSIKIDIYGQGGEFTLGQVDKKQIQFIYDKLKNADDDGGRKHIDDEVFETDDISLPWNEIDDITHMYGVNPDRFYLDSEDENFEDINIDTKGLGTFEIDYENDDRLEFVDDNKKVILGWDNLDASFDKGFHTFKTKDFSETSLEIFKGGSLVGTDSIEKGHFGKFELPGDFDKSKLILVWSKFKFEENETNHPNTILSKIFYDGEEIEIDDGEDTTTKEQYHFIIESSYEEGDDEVSFDYTGDEFTTG